MKVTMIVCSLGILYPGCDFSAPWPSPGPTGNTAARKLEEVKTIAESYGKGLRLLTVRSHQVRTDGTSDTWQYQYVDSGVPPTSYWFHSSSTTVGFDSTSPTGVGAAVITHKWYDSDYALGIAERNGGTQFRTQYPHCTISASMGEPVVPDPTTSWWITYRSDDNNTKSLSFAIDAGSGAVTMRYP
jgi:hypothetical protein